jgi:5'-deoxynucleotidase YfbR-like HD superfamily hydrolase
MAETSGPVIETYTGGRFRPFDPRPADVCLLDIAAGLAHTCRFGGHCRQFYSVAGHSLHVSHEFDDPRLQVLALLHDAGEAYVGDIPRPVKAELDRMERAEATIRDAVWTALGVAPPTAEEWERVMAADDRLLAYEADRLLADGSWAAASPDLGYELGADSVEAVRDRFHTRGEQLLARLDERD